MRKAQEHSSVVEGEATSSHERIHLFSTLERLLLVRNSVRRLMNMVNVLQEIHSRGEIDHGDLLIQNVVRHSRETRPGEKNLWGKHLARSSVLSSIDVSLRDHEGDPTEYRQRINTMRATLSAWEYAIHTEDIPPHLQINDHLPGESKIRGEDLILCSLQEERMTKEYLGDDLARIQGLMRSAIARLQSAQSVEARDEEVVEVLRNRAVSAQTFRDMKTNFSEALQSQQSGKRFENL